jgi:hypothetical protein
LKNKFDESPGIETLQDIHGTSAITQEREALIMHNNFGICNQQKYIATNEGLARIKALFTNQLSASNTQMIETPFAEVAAYETLVTRSPSYLNFFSDLYSKTPFTVTDDFNFFKAY